VDQGWPLETLFSWVGLFFQKKQSPYDTFAGNLRFLIQQLSWSRQKYRVILRLSGSSKLSGFGNFAGFNFRALPGFTPDGSGPQRKFAITSSLTTFAETPVEAVDLTAAAITAREKFEQCLDQLRFNFEPEPLKVDERCFVERLGDHHTDIRVVRHLVPNPHHHLTPDAFREFSEGMEAMLSRAAIEPESRERLRAATTVSAAMRTPTRTNSSTGGWGWSFCPTSALTGISGARWRSTRATPCSSATFTGW
jgi:hypothetical protein